MRCKIGHEIEGIVPSWFQSLITCLCLCPNCQTSMSHMRDTASCREFLAHDAQRQSISQYIYDMQHACMLSSYRFVFRLFECQNQPTQPKLLAKVSFDPGTRVPRRRAVLVGCRVHFRRNDRISTANMPTWHCTVLVLTLS